MECLRFYTRQMSSPQGKPRVFFCCHPDDFADCFTRIADRILKEQNCAIWYREPTCRDAVPFSDLEQMQLFVMPVTTKLLTTQNRAIDVEFPFAIRQHIPVLPLMQEPGLEQLFNCRCGELQYLDEQAQDSAMLRFDDKLRRYLNDILIGDELAGKIRAAFDGYIFLSYRKKDRQYVTELMRKIHQNDFAKDIAIWYDEYLVPGENFNVSIAEALRKSELFTMLVTPNLANEPNYVSMTEYPEAVKAGKPILPVEASSTDQKTLRTRFQQLPPCVSIADEKELSAALMRSLRRMGKAENDGDPMHQYLIGLAYLNGIDVEVDYTRARELLTASAEQGMVDAMERLVSMYEHGKGVDYNIDFAIQWQERLTACRRENARQTPNRAALESLYYALAESGNLYAAARKINHMAEIYAEASTFCMKNQTVLPDAYSRAAYCSAKLGMALRMQGKLEQAAKKLHTAAGLYHIVYKTNQNADYLRCEVVCIEEEGVIFGINGNFSSARGCYGKALELLSPIGGSPAMNEIATIYTRMGELYIYEQNMSAAKIYYEKALQMRTQIASSSDEPEARTALAKCYCGLAACEKADGISYLEKAINIYKEQAEERPTFSAQYQLYDAEMKMGRKRMSCGQIAEANSHFAEAEIGLAQLAKKTGDPVIQICHAESFMWLGKTHWAKREISPARDFFMQAIQEARSLPDSFQVGQVAIDMAESDIYLARIYKTEKDFTKAKSYYLQAVACFTDEILATEYVGWHKMYAYALLEYADCCKDLQEDCEAVQAYTQSLQAFDWLLVKTSACDLYGYAGSAAYAANKLGQLLQQSGQMNLAKNTFQRAQQYAKQSLDNARTDQQKQTAQERQLFALHWRMVLDDENDLAQTASVYREAWDCVALMAKDKETEKLYKARASILEKLRTVFQKTNDPSALRILYTEAFTLSDTLMEQGATPELQYERAHILKELSAIHQVEGNAPMAETCCCDAQRLYKASAQALRTFASYDEWMVSSIMLGNIYRRRGAYKEAKPYYEEAIRVGESMERATPKEKTKRQLAFAKKCLQGMN